VIVVVLPCVCHSCWGLPRCQVLGGARRWRGEGAECGAGRWGLHGQQRPEHAEAALRGTGGSRGQNVLKQVCGDESEREINPAWGDTATFERIVRVSISFFWEIGECRLQRPSASCVKQSMVPSVAGPLSDF
jgi:hypothetical protein